MLGSPLIVYALLAVVGGLGVKVFAKKDTAREQRRMGANRMAGTLRSYGFKKLPSFFEMYGVGDYSGMGHMAGDLYRLTTEGEDGFVNELRAAFKNVLAEQVRSDEGRAYIQAVMDEAKRTPAPVQAIKPLVK